MAEAFDFTPGPGPLLISIPHAGLEIPSDIRADFSLTGLSNQDADHFVDRLYGFSEAPKLAGKYSRYVLDLNRAPEDTDLYPGQFTTGLFPTVSFGKDPVYQPGKAPEGFQKNERVDLYHRPYHCKLAETLKAIKDAHGRALLWEAHSIKSRVPALFDGTLPDFNFGTNDGASCSLPVEDAFKEVMEEFSQYSFVFNGRFQGGWTTRHYGRPDEDFHAVQLELSKAIYMDEDSLVYDENKAGQVQYVLARLLETFQDL